MKVHSSKMKVSGPPAHSSLRTNSTCSGSHRGPVTSSPRRIKAKRKQSFDNESNSLVLLTNVIKKAKIGMKKKARYVQNGSSQNSNWHVSHVKNSSTDVSQASEVADHLMNSDNDISAIYKSSDEESFGSEYGDHSRDLTSEDVDRMLEAAEYASDVDSNYSDDEFFQKKKEEFSYQTGPPFKKQKISKAEAVSPFIITPLYSRNSVVVVMNHPTSITLNEYLSVEVLLGSVSIYGHELKPQSIPVKVFSSKSTGLVEVKTESYDNPWKRKETYKNLKHKLYKVTGNKKKSLDILSKVKETMVVVVIEGCIFPRNLQFLELYYPKVLNFKLTKHFLNKVWGEERKYNIKEKIFCLPSNENSVQFSPDADDLASDIISAIRNSKLRDSEGPRVLVFGPKNTGKSSLIRYLMNKALSMFPVVYYLDTDPGQTEFTPPGVVSLTEVTKPVIGPAFCHQRKPLSMTFTGGVSADMSPDMYSKSVAKLVLLFRQNLPTEPLFVNTMGWIKGLGLECLKNVMKTVNPTILVETITEDEDTMFDYRDYLTDKIQFYQIRSPFSSSLKRKTDKVPSQKERELSLLSYFGRCQSLHERPTYLNSFKPICVSWDKIPVYMFGKKIVSYRLIESLNASVVALCKVDESLILESNIPSLPKTLEDDPDNECIGFGIVRAIDEAKHFLYIVTPLSLDEMKHVNAIIKGNVAVPDTVFLKQPITGVPLPFTDEKGNISESDSESLSESETFVDVNRVSNIYRKSIQKRFQRRKHN